jgi:hypothetical protein
VFYLGIQKRRHVFFFLGLKEQSKKEPGKGMATEMTMDTTTKTTKLFSANNHPSNFANFPQPLHTTSVLQLNGEDGDDCRKNVGTEVTESLGVLRSNSERWVKVNIKCQALLMRALPS